MTIQYKKQNINRPRRQVTKDDQSMTEKEILGELGFSLGLLQNYAFYRWRQVSVQDLPPSLREWALDELVRLMREHGQPCGVHEVRRD